MECTKLIRGTSVLLDGIVIFESLNINGYSWLFFIYRVKHIIHVIYSCLNSALLNTYLFWNRPSFIERPLSFSQNGNLWTVI